MPMNMSCPNCNLVYDLSVYEPGQRCRCHCGQVIVVPNEMPEFRVRKAQREDVYLAAGVGSGLMKLITGLFD